jgi:hypothetical protein
MKLPAIFILNKFMYILFYIIKRSKLENI